MKTTNDLKKSNEAYRLANPWIIQNNASLGTMCGRYPTRQAAEEAAASYRGGVTHVNENTKTVHVYDMPYC
jgi:hypothetical protein